MQDVNCIVSALGYATCTLVSHDWGGVVAWWAASKYPATVTKVRRAAVLERPMRVIHTDRAVAMACDAHLPA